MKIRIKSEKGEKTIVLDRRSVGAVAEKARSKAAECRAMIKSEVDAVRERDPAANDGMSDLEILTLYSGVHAIVSHRLAHGLYEKGLTFPARVLSQCTRLTTGIEIHPAAQIGQGVFIDHGSGVVIGETAIVGDNCTIYQGATLGGTGKETGKRHPTIGEGVMVGAGAKVLGPVNIGDHSKIAAGAVVLKDIPPHCTAVGIPARIVRMNDERVEDLDQIHIPDPVERELSKLRGDLARLEEKLARQAATGKENAAGETAGGKQDEREG